MSKCGSTSIHIKTSWIAHTKDIYCLKAFSDGNIIATGSLDWTIKLWELSTGKCKHTLQGHTDSITTICLMDFSVFSSSLDGTIREWDSVSGYCKKVIISGHGRTRAIDCCGSWLVSGGWDENIRVWNAMTGKMVHEFSLERGPIVSVQATDRMIIVATKGQGIENEITLMDFGDEDLRAEAKSSEDVKDDALQPTSILSETILTLRRQFYHSTELSEDHTIQNVDEVTDYQPCTEGDDYSDDEDNGSDFTWEDAEGEEIL
ncbi:WD40-repeat-containing domain protein [Chytridium lagenaria]|nr:WD40-repeat-containing domain protein [Chytridium lagenaria]